jgi:uncharacterized membrane protein (UPF0127 family)
VQLINDRTRRAIADAVEMADTRKARRRGLLGRDCLQEGAALMLIPCCAVHTAFMRFSIDLAFLDRDGRIVRMVSRMRPWRIAIAWRARAVIELPAGRLESLAVRLGDRLYVKPARDERRAS